LSNLEYIQVHKVIICGQRIGRLIAVYWLALLSLE